MAFEREQLDELVYILLVWGYYNALWSKVVPLFQESSASPGSCSGLGTTSPPEIVNFSSSETNHKRSPRSPQKVKSSTCEHKSTLSVLVLERTGQQRCADETHELGNSRDPKLQAIASSSDLGGRLGSNCSATLSSSDQDSGEEDFQETETGLARYVRSISSVRRRLNVEEMDPLEFSMLDFAEGAEEEEPLVHDAEVQAGAGELVPAIASSSSAPRPNPEPEVPTRRSDPSAEPDHDELLLLLDWIRTT